MNFQEGISRSSEAKALSVFWNHFFRYILWSAWLLLCCTAQPLSPSVRNVFWSNFLLSSDNCRKWKSSLESTYFALIPQIPQNTCTNFHRTLIVVLLKWLNACQCCSEAQFLPNWLRRWDLTQYQKHWVEDWKSRNVIFWKAMSKDSQVSGKKFFGACLYSLPLAWSKFR